MQGSVEVPCERLSTSQYRDSAVIAYQPLTPLTDDYSPLTNAFELQQTTIEQSREAFERIVEFQLQMSEAAISGTEVTGELYRQGIEMNGGRCTATSTPSKRRSHAQMTPSPRSATRLTNSSISSKNNSRRHYRWSRKPLVMPSNPRTQTPRLLCTARISRGPV